MTTDLIMRVNVRTTTPNNKGVVDALPFPPSEASEEHGVVNPSKPVIVRFVRAPRHATVE